MWTVALVIITFLIGVAVGALVWRNNAVKFKQIEDAAKEKGKSILDLLK